MRLSRKTKFFTLVAVLSVMTFGLFQNATIPAPDMGIQLSPERAAILANCRPPGSTTLGRYQREVFTNVKIREIPYAARVPSTINLGVNKGTIINAHLLDLYTGDDNDDPTDEARALIVWVHGGGFAGGDKGNYPEHLIKLAKRGFVVASINYRLLRGMEDVPAGKQPSWAAEEDLQSALRFLYKEASIYNIDRNKIFIAGSSAGAITALTVALKRDSEIQIAGAVGISGGVFDSNIIDQNDTVPLLMFHHVDDTTNPYGVGTNKQGVTLYGSGEIKRVLSDLRIETTLIKATGATRNGVSTHVEYALTPNNLGGKLNETVNRESKFFYPLICGQ